MNDFFEATLTAHVQKGSGQVYKKAIEAENSPQGLRDNWNGNHAHVEVREMRAADELTIHLVSHTQSNLEETVNWRVSQGATLEFKNF